MVLYKWHVKINHIQAETEDEALAWIKKHLFFLALQPVEDLKKHFLNIEDSGYYGEHYDFKLGKWTQSSKPKVKQDE
jgi:hypothetical protein